MTGESESSKEVSGFWSRQGSKPREEINYETMNGSGSPESSLINNPVLSLSVNMKCSCGVTKWPQFCILYVRSPRRLLYCCLIGQLYDKEFG